VADNVQIMCINKRDRADRHERISHIGGVNVDGSRWRMSETDAIAGIKGGKWRFFVHAGGKSVLVVIANHFGREYLKTEADGLLGDNLLSLPNCPA
jgi:hypothetical protein